MPVQHHPTTNNVAIRWYLLQSLYYKLLCNDSVSVIDLSISISFNNALHLEIGDEVEYRVEKDQLIIVPIRKKKLLTEDYLISQLSSDSFQDLVADLIPEEYEV